MSLFSPKSIPPRVRFLVPSDHLRAHQIYRLAFPLRPWSETQFYREATNHPGRVVEAYDPYQRRLRVVAFSLFHLNAFRAEVLAFAVHPQYQRRGHGRLLIQEIAQLLTPLRSMVEVVVGEEDLDTQLFLRAVGFRVGPDGIVRDPKGRRPDCYRFTLREPTEERQTEPVHSRGDC